MSTRRDGPWLLGILLSAAVGHGLAGESLTPPVRREGIALAAATTLSFDVALRAGQALRGAVVQRGVDVVVRVLDPAGAVVAEVDSPNGTDGPEPVLVIAAASGPHRLEIRPFETGASSGRLDLALEAVREATREDRDLVAAAALYTRAFAERNEALRFQGQADHTRAAPLYAAARDKAQRALALQEAAAATVESGASHALLGLIDDEVGDYEAGERHFQRALDSARASHGVDHPATLTTLSDLGYLKLANGDWSGARATFAEALARREAALGPDHPRLLNGLAGFGQVLMYLGELELAERTLRRAIAIREAQGGNRAPLAGHWIDLAHVAGLRGRHDEALALCARAAEVAAEGSHLAGVQACRGEARLGRGEAAAAVPDLRAWAQRREAQGGPDHPWVGRAQGLLGLALLRAGETDAARASLERARRIQERRLGARHPHLADTLHAQAELALVEGAPDRARLLLERALVIRSARLPVAHPDVVATQEALARLP